MSKIFEFKMTTRPDHVDHINHVVYSKESYEKIRTSEYVKELIKAGSMYIYYYSQIDTDSDFRKSIFCNEENNILGKVIEWNEDSIKVSLSDYAAKWFETHDPKEYTAGMRMIGDTEIVPDHLFGDVYKFDIANVSGFDLLKNRMHDLELVSYMLKNKVQIAVVEYNNPKMPGTSI